MSRLEVDLADVDDDALLDEIRRRMAARVEQGYPPLRAVARHVAHRDSSTFDPDATV